MNPTNPGFWDLWYDVDGLRKWGFRQFLNPDISEVPTYVPMVKNGCSRITHLEEETVAIPFFRVIGLRKGGTYGSRFADGQDLRMKFMLKPDCRIILVGVCEDPQLELFWQEHQVANLAEELANLDIMGVTAPNFSAFEDMSKFQVFRNLKRMLLVCERFSEWRISVIPHLTAIDPSQWRLWAEFLQQHPEVSVVTKEFQTGFKPYEKGRIVIDELSRLQEQLGRPLHPILIGGGTLYKEASARFGQHFSVIDSRPHMLSMSRILLNELSDTHYEEVQIRTATGQGIDAIYRENIKVHHRNMQLGRRKRVFKNESCNSELHLETSSPYLICHPAA